MDPRLAAAPFIQFEGRRILVSGASSGIGRAVAIELARHGASLLLLGRDQARLDETMKLLSGDGHRALQLDLRQPSEIGAALQEEVPRRGRWYGLCHCAGLVQTLPLGAIGLEALREMFEVNVTSALELARVVCRRDSMLEDGGSVVFVSSIYGTVGMPGQIAYSASKGALVSAARAMAMELARRNIRVNTVSPGLVHTPLADAALGRLEPARVQQLEANHPLGPGTPEDVARAIAFLLAPETRWITGTNLVVDGGYTAQ